MKRELIISEPEELRQLIKEALSELLQEYALDDKGSDNDKEVFTNRQAMEYLNVSRSTLQRWRNEGKLPYRKIEGTILYTQKDIDQLLEEAIK